MLSTDTSASSPAETAPATGRLDGERSDLLASLAHARFFLKHTARGLTTEQAALQPTAGTLSIGGLVKHVTAVERGWIRFIRGGAEAMMDGQKAFADWTAEDFAAREREFQLQPGETLEGVLAAYDALAGEVDVLVRTFPSLDTAHELPKAPWNTDREWSIRRVLLHIVAETAQHAGHADIIRESIDGAQSMA